MKRTLFYLALGLVLGLCFSLGAGFLVRLGSAGTNSYVCEAAETPASYRGEWFYRLQAAPGGWLFRPDDLTTAFALEQETLSYLETLNQVLANRGVTLVVAAQPPRGVALSADSLPEYAPGEAVAEYEAARRALQGAGLYVTDLTEVVEATPNYFFRRDHHWTPDGSRASAEAVARTLRSTPEFRSVAAQQRAFETETVRSEAQVGSFGEAIGRICGESPPAETLTRYRTAPAADTAPENSDLFAASTPPIVLAGTSNSAREDLNFSGFLAQASGLEVLNVSEVGGGAQAALDAYLRSETFQAAKPTFLVWEFATLFDVPQDPLFYRQLIPSVRGGCSTAEAEASVTKPLGRTVPLLTGVQSETAGQGETSGYLYLQLSDLAQTSLGLRVGYQDGRVETVRLERPERERNDGRFFLSFDAPPTSVTLTLPAGASGEVQARLCS